MKIARCKEILVAVSLLVAGAAYAEPVEQQLAALPAAVKQAITAVSPQGSVVSIEPKTMEGAMRYKVGVQEQGKKRSLVIEANGHLLVAKTEVAVEALPPPVGKTLQAQTQGAKIETVFQVSRSGKTYYEIDLQVDGHKKEIVIEPSGEVTKIEEVVPLASVPAVVQSVINKQASRGKLLKVKTIVLKGKLSAYEAAVDVNGVKTEFKLTPEGQPFKLP